jgi:hypothetical protein
MAETDGVARCVICGRDLREKRGGAKYCSKLCQRQAYRVPKKQRQCVTCGALFVVRTANQRYCSDKCAGRESREHLKWKKVIKPDPRPTPKPQPQYCHRSKADLAKCGGCLYSGRGSGGDHSQVTCDYLLITGHSRRLICKAGVACTVYKPSGGQQRRVANLGDGAYGYEWRETATPET